MRRSTNEKKILCGLRVLHFDFNHTMAFTENALEATYYLAYLPTQTF